MKNHHEQCDTFYFYHALRYDYILLGITKKFSKNRNVIFFGWVLHRTNIVKVIWRLPSFTGGGRPQVSLNA